MLSTVLEIDECSSISLVGAKGEEITATTRRDRNGELIVSLYVDDGYNITCIDIPRFMFDQFMLQMRMMH